MSGMLTALVMKAELARLKGEESTAAQADERYLQILADGQAERLERL